MNKQSIAKICVDIAIMGLFVWLGHYLAKGLKSVPAPKKTVRSKLLRD